jgi:hypothetical protein
MTVRVFLALAALVDLYGCGHAIARTSWIECDRG